MPKKYTTETFREIVFSKKNWISWIDEYDSKKDKISIKCNFNHELLADTKALVREDKLKCCPICDKEQKEKKCLVCGEILKSGQIKFCSSSHAAIFNNSKRRKKVRLCIFCNKELTHKQTKFCSSDCQHEFYYEKFIDDWRKGIIKIESSQISNYIRKYLFRKYNNSCCKCGWSEKNIFSNTYPLEVHHVDGNYKNNDENNLELLCPNCHSLTDTFKNLNKGNGRGDER